MFDPALPFARLFPAHQTARTRVGCTRCSAIGSILATTLALGSLACASLSEAGGEHEFDWTVGVWEGVRRDVASGREQPLRMRVEALLGPGGQLRHLEVTGNDGVYHGAAVQTLDRDGGRWLRQYTNSTDRPFARLAGEVLVAGERSVWRSITPGRTRRSRLLSERLPGDRWRRSMSASADDGATWRGLWVDDLRRQR